MKTSLCLLSAIFLFALSSCSNDDKKPDPVKSGSVNPDSVNPVVKPVAGFSSDVKTITAGGKVNFKDTSTNSPTSWAWTFEGGTPGRSTAQNPDNIVYATVGQYKVSLVATNSEGSNTMEIEKYITVTPDPNSFLPRKVTYTKYRGGYDDNYHDLFNYNGNKITQIWENHGDFYDFTYSGNKIVNVRNYNHYSSNRGSSTDYTYENNDLKSYEIDNSSYNIIKYTYNSDNTILVASKYIGDGYGYEYTKNSSVFTLDTKGNIIKVAYSNGEVLTIEYDTKNNPYKNILGYSSLLQTKYDISESDSYGNFIIVPHFVNAFNQDAYSINNITKEEKKDKNGKIISTTTFENTYNVSNFLIKTVVKSNPAKEYTDGTYEYTY